MIICSCNVLTRARIVRAAEEIAAARPGRPVTAGMVFRALGVRAQCATCFPLIRRVLAESGVAITCPEPIAGEETDEVTP